MISIESSLCKKCNLCVLACPGEVFKKSNQEHDQYNNGVPQIKDTHLCIECGHCVAVCPEGAVVHNAITAIQSVKAENLLQYDGLEELLRSRRSIRKFKESPVEKELLEKIIQLAKYAPTSHNCQSTKYLIIQNKDLLKEVSRLTVEYSAKVKRKLQNPFIRTLLLLIVGEAIKTPISLIPTFERIKKSWNEGKDPILHNAPTVIVFYAKTIAPFAEINANLALYNVSLICHQLSLGSFCAGSVMHFCQRENKINKLLNIPEGHNIYGVLAVGQPKYKFKKWVERKPADIQWM
jgi:nitroreductase/NAD-dependent dihydropyrimidine dehydrogenase PreA subunit